NVARKIARSAFSKQEARKKQESQQEERESKQEITASSTNDKQESTSCRIVAHTGLGRINKHKIAKN
ncbi:hypothetical protein Tco_0589614, partial [Tanacetum coccineum]